MATTAASSSSSASTVRTPDPSGSSSAPGCLLRLFWILFGHLALLVFAVLIFQRGQFSELDVAYWATVAALVAARYVDIVRFRGSTADGDPATLHHFRRFALYLAIVAAAGWVVVHGWNSLSGA